MTINLTVFAGTAQGLLHKDLPDSVRGCLGSFWVCSTRFWGLWTYFVLAWLGSVLLGSVQVCLCSFWVHLVRFGLDWAVLGLPDSVRGCLGSFWVRLARFGLVRLGLE